MATCKLHLLSHVWMDRKVTTINLLQNCEDKQIQLTGVYIWKVKLGLVLKTSLLGFFFSVQGNVLKFSSVVIVHTLQMWNSIPLFLVFPFCHYRSLCMLYVYSDSHVVAPSLHCPQERIVRAWLKPTCQLMSAKMCVSLASTAQWPYAQIFSGALWCHSSHLSQAVQCDAMCWPQVY